jgi:hypothetical protein
MAVHLLAHLAAYVVLGLILFLVCLGSFLLYFAPTIAAFVRGTPNRWLTLVLNVLFGWTLVGWLVLFFWACSERTPVAYASGRYEA